jgi:hypothetical protein
LLNLIGNDERALAKADGVFFIILLIAQAGQRRRERIANSLG